VNPKDPVFVSRIMSYPFLTNPLKPAGQITHVALDHSSSQTNGYRHQREMDDPDM
jgi:hypothetical protein